MDNKEIIIKNIQSAADLKTKLLTDETLLNTVGNVADKLADCFRSDGKVLLCGNGGSAADAQHLAAEFSGRYYKDRPPLYAEALHVNSSYVTAVANDYSYDEIYARAVRAMGRKDDILICMSTSGNSPNVLRAIHAAKAQNMIVIGMTGKSGGDMRELCDILIAIPSTDTPRIQECHMLLGHTICQLVEDMIFPA
jgi:D-sedoheptulose 7-phosphate isomerase